jgi:hypothetical protein
MAESEQFERGLEIRREVLGTDYVDANLAGTDELSTGVSVAEIQEVPLHATVAGSAKVGHAFASS